MLLNDAKIMENLEGRVKISLIKNIKMGYHKNSDSPFKTHYKK
jgi:hypothetical protein